MRAHKMHGILLAGVNGYKIYALNDRLRIVARYQFKDVADSDSRTVLDYVNLKYQPLSEREGIIQAFLKLTEEIFI